MMTSSGSAVFSMPTRIYIEDTDAGGIVYYVNYLKFFERVRTEHLRAYNITKPAFLNNETMLVVASSNIRYLKPAKLDDLLQVTSQIINMKRTYLLFHHTMILDNTIYCEAEVKVGCVDRKTMKPTRISTDISQCIDYNTP
jgi:4-hydroxybenzoyl-CoA thioesterase